MRQTIRTYIHTILLFFIPFVVISLILAILSYFMQLDALYIQIIIQVISYLTLIISALYMTSHLEKNRLMHCFLLSILYFLCSLLMHLGNIQYVHLFFKSLLFLIVCIIKEIRDHKVI